MDDEFADLIGRLSVQAGMLMEDRCPELIMRLPSEQLAVEGRVDRMARTGRILTRPRGAKIMVSIIVDSDYGELRALIIEAFQRFRHHVKNCVPT